MAAPAVGWSIRGSSALGVTTLAVTSPVDGIHPQRHDAAFRTAQAAVPSRLHHVPARAVRELLMRYGAVGVIGSTSRTRIRRSSAACGLLPRAAACPRALASVDIAFRPRYEAPTPGADRLVLGGDHHHVMEVAQVGLGVRDTLVRAEQGHAGDETHRVPLCVPPGLRQSDVVCECASHVPAFRTVAVAEHSVICADPSVVISFGESRATTEPSATRLLRVSGPSLRRPPRWSRDARRRR